jgi:hypothetical protein
LEHCSGYGVPVLFSCMCGQPSLWITFSSQKNPVVFYWWLNFSSPV